MRITIFGSGYFGLVTGACMAEVGNDMVCFDIDEDKIARLNKGEVPICEPGLESYIKRNEEVGRLEFTTDVKKAVDHGFFQFIAVGTLPDDDGSADLKHVLAVARSIGENMDEYRIVVDKSTGPVGTADKVNAEIAKMLTKRGKSLEFGVVSNPEFLKEGTTIDDFMRPDRIIVGTDNPRTTELLDTAKLDGLGWTPGIDLKDGIASTYEWFQENAGIPTESSSAVQSNCATQISA